MSNSSRKLLQAGCIVLGLAASRAQAERWDNIRTSCQGTTLRVSAQLMDIQGSWEAACGRQRSGPLPGLGKPRCVNNFGMWGEWDVADSQTCGGAPAPAPAAVESPSAAEGEPRKRSGLPYAADVPAGQSLGLDGVWRYSHMNKTVRFQGQRYFAIDPWVHALVVPVQQDMVIGNEIRKTGPGRFQGYDLPTNARATYELQPSGHLKVKVKALFARPFELIPVTLDDPGAYNRLMGESGFVTAMAPVPSSPSPVAGGAPSAPVSSPANCQRPNYDPATGQTTCLD
ncbi:MAG: hypothetical protein H6509_04235 [Bryobacterales bacterium]|nr:hypothetical protein [Bryobacterales bacterium]